MKKSEATTDEATTDEATTDEATTDEATTDEATANEATANEATANEATANKMLAAGEKQAANASDIISDIDKLTRRLYSRLPVAKLRACERAFVAAHKDEIAEFAKATVASVIPAKAEK